MKLPIRFKENLLNLNKRTLLKIGTLPVMAMMMLSSSQAFAISRQEAQNQVNQINQQINKIDNSLAANKQQQDTLAGEVAAIEARVQSIQLQLQATSYQIDILNSQIDETNGQIKSTQAELASTRKEMGEYLKTMYMNGQVSTVEMIATSNSFSDFVDRDQYLTSMEQKIQADAQKILDLEKSLEQKKKELTDEKADAEKLKASQLAQKAAVVAQQNYKNQLLANAKAAAQSLNNQKDALYNKKAQLSAAFNETVTVGGSSSYPYGNPPPSYRIDTPDDYGYFIGECTSYVAWKRASIGRPIPRAMGNGGQWGYNAANLGYRVDSTPSVGAAMVFPYIGGYGHVAYVEAVYGNGTVLISEYNWTPFRYGQRVVNPYNYSSVFVH